MKRIHVTGFQSHPQYLTDTPRSITLANITRYPNR